MAGASLTCAAILLLLSGQGTTDRKQFTAYQVELARVMAADAVGTSVSPAAAAQGTCILVPGSGNGATTRDCTVCHVGFQGSHSHPVDVDHEAARFRSAGGSGPSLRPAADVVKRGVFLADGKVTCLTCHDGSSPWKAKLALPPDALLRQPVKPGSPQTYDPAQMRPSPLTGLTASAGKAVLPAGTEVSPTPLCKACHSFD